MRCNPFASYSCVVLATIGAISACGGEVEVTHGTESETAASPTEDVAMSAQELSSPAPDHRAFLSPVARYTKSLLDRPVESQAVLTIVFVLDGMRPDLINATDTPNLYRLRDQGVSFPNGHAVFPTVTRVNSPSIATGMYPAQAGIIGNSVFIPELNTTEGVNTGDWRVMKQLDEVSGGRLLFVDSLAQRLHAAGKTLAAVSSGSSGSAYLLNHRAEQGVGILVSGYLEDGNGRVAFPDAVDGAIRARFPTPPPKSGTNGGNLAVDWTEELLREYVIPELRPDVVLNWLTEPDGSHHSFGTNSPEGTAAIRNDDRNIGLVLEKLAALGIADKTNIFVISDHGFGVNTEQVNLVSSLVDAGLKQAASSDDVVIANNAHAGAIHVKGHDPRKIRAIVRHLQAQAFTGVLFTKSRPGQNTGDAVVEGWVPGTFSTGLIHLDNEERGADIVVTFDWSSAKNAFGIPGTDTNLSSTGPTGPLTGNASSHGSMSPWCVRNTWLAWGADFKDGIVDRTPVSNVDVSPTVLALQGLDASKLDGRVLVEAIEGGPDYEKLPFETKTYLTDAGDYRTAIQVTELGHQRYIDKSWRLP